MIKILFLINTLGGGGAERVLVNLVNHMDKNKFDITVETMFADGVNQELLDKSIKQFCRNKLKIRGLSNLIKFLPESFLYQYYIGNQQYDILVAYMHGAPTKVVAGCKNTTSKKVSWLHYGDPESGSFFDYWWNKEDAFRAYAAMDAIVGVSESVSNAFSDYTNIKNNCYTLYNTNDTERILRMSKAPVSGIKKGNVPVICTCGRLTHQKGFDRLMEAAVRLHSEGKEFEVWIMGSGPEKDKLDEKINKNNGGAYIRLLGFCENPYNIMRLCDGFLLPSREEGLATVLTEALTLELPIVSTDVSGAREVLGDHNEYGLVVENGTEGIYAGLKTMLTDSVRMNAYREKAKQRAKCFDTESTVKKTEEFFENLYASR